MDHITSTNTPIARIYFNHLPSLQGELGSMVKLHTGEKEAEGSTCQFTASCLLLGTLVPAAPYRTRPPPAFLLHQDLHVKLCQQVLLEGHCSWKAASLPDLVGWVLLSLLLFPCLLAVCVVTSSSGVPQLHTTPQQPCSPCRASDYPPASLLVGTTHSRP